MHDWPTKIKDLLITKFYIEQYADSFNIPKKIAYGIARMETGYRGYKHWKYSQNITFNVIHVT